jgi:hypothetical protein
MENKIRFEEAVKLVDSGAMIDVVYVKLDVRRKTGGQKTFATVQLATRKKTDSSNFETVKTSSNSKSPNHSENFTRNFFICQNGRATSAMKRIHLPLLLEINQQKVLL